MLGPLTLAMHACMHACCFVVRVIGGMVVVFPMPPTSSIFFFWCDGCHVWSGLLWWWWSVISTSRLLWLSAVSMSACQHVSLSACQQSACSAFSCAKGGQNGPPGTDFGANPMGPRPNMFCWVSQKQGMMVCQHFSYVGRGRNGLSLYGITAKLVLQAQCCTDSATEKVPVRAKIILGMS